MHLLLKCVIPYEILYVNNIQYLTCNLDDVVICDSELAIEGNNVGFGLNCRTSQYGLFPIKNFAIFDSTNIVNVDLTKVIKKYEANMNLFTKTNIPGIFHRSSKKSLAIPIICALCGEYMMGLRPEFIHCFLCNQAFHGLCWKNHVSVKKCYRFFKITSPTIISSFRTSEMDLSEWSKDQILQWLCSVNLFRMLDLFDVKNINGKSLLALMPENDEAILNDVTNTLPFWSSIPDKFCRESLYLAIRELLGQSDDSNQGLRGSRNIKFDVGANTNECLSQSSYIIVAGYHHLREVTFMCKTYCYYCAKILIGINKQGLHCVKCRLDFHKTCAAQIDIMYCQGVVAVDQVDQLDSSVFGVPLKNQVQDQSSVPMLLKCCIRQLESRQSFSGPGSKLLELYGESANTEDLIKLRTLFSHPIYDGKGDLKDLSCLSHSLVAKLVKFFFKELPEPLFTYALYHSFVDGMRYDYDDHSNCSHLHSLLLHLPAANRATLQLLVNHFENICQRSFIDHSKVRQIAEKWSFIFSKTLIWPPHIMLNEVVNHKIKHRKIIQLLFEYKLLTFEKFTWPILPENEYATCGDQDFSLSQSLTTQQLSCLEFDVADVNDNIHCHDWYWSDTTKEEVNDVMAGLPDGSFLIRDSSNKIAGEFTLTVRKDGENKLLRIMSSCGLYGFKEPYEFRSVAQLVSYYQTMKLSNYNDQLNLTLSFPVSKRKSEVYGRSNDSYALDDNTLIDMFYKTMNECLEVNTRIERNTLECESCQKELDELTKTIKGVDLVYTWCNNHTEHIMNTMFNNPKMKDHNQKSLQMLNKRLNSCAEVMKMSNILRETLTVKSTSLMKSLSVDRPNLKKLNRRQQQCIRQLKERGVPAEMFDDENIDLDELCEEVRKNLNRSNPINDESTWFIEVLTRLEATAILTGKRHGTFLVRKSKEVNSYALDIVVNNTVQHCLIYCVDGMYGFVKNECLYGSLKDLVKTFHLRSLDQYNKDLKTKLTYPVNCVSTSF